MFWSSATTSSNIDQVLDDAGVTLQKVLEQDEVLQELRAMNKKLVEFLSRPESLNGMIDLITTEPSPDTPLASQYKLPNVVSRKNQLTLHVQCRNDMNFYSISCTFSLGLRNPH